jgi:hypothetical protein
MASSRTMMDGNDQIHAKELSKYLPLRKEVSRCSITIGTKGWFAKTSMAYHPPIFQSSPVLAFLHILHAFFFPFNLRNASSSSTFM